VIQVSSPLSQFFMRMTEFYFEIVKEGFLLSTVNIASLNNENLSIICILRIYIYIYIYIYI
jgi:hypothetical protein